MKLLPIVEVWWRDAEAHNQWEVIGEVNVPPKCRTVGILIEKTRKHLVIAATHSGDNINNRMVIPRGWIEELTTLKAGSRKEVDIYEPPKAKEQAKAKKTPEGSE